MMKWLFKGVDPILVIVICMVTVMMIGVVMFVLIPGLSGGEPTEASQDPTRWELIESPLTGRCYEVYNLPGTSEGFLWELVDCKELRR